MSRIKMVRTALAVAVVAAMSAGAMSAAADAKGGRNFARHHGGGVKISVGFKHHDGFAFHKFGGYGTGCGYWKFGKWFPCTVSSSY